MNAHDKSITGLVFVSDDMPGIRREKSGDRFTYFDPDNKIVRQKEDISRIEALGIPPAYQEVWICPLPNGHLQATGMDDRKRKQYRYHTDWTAYRSEQKFQHLVAFGEKLPRLRRKIREDLKQEVGNLHYTLAALVSLLDHTGIRPGNQKYSQTNQTYGATTLKSRHLHCDDDEMFLKYRGKGGKRIQRTIRSKRLHRILDEFTDLPGKELFTFKSENGDFKPVDTARLNAYICKLSGLDTASSKTFRTWLGSLTAFTEALNTYKKDGSSPTIKALCDASSQRLANTPAICRSSYVHPKIIGLADDQSLDLLEKIARVSEDTTPRADLKLHEELMLGFLA